MRKLKDFELDLLLAARDEPLLLDTPGKEVKYRKLNAYCARMWDDAAYEDEDWNKVGAWSAWTYEDDDELNAQLDARVAELASIKRKTAGVL